MSSISNGNKETRLYIGNLPSSATELALISLLSPYGRIVNLDYMWHRHGPLKGTPRGYAFVELESNSEADRCVKASSLGGGWRLGNQRLVVRKSTTRRAADDSCRTHHKSRTGEKGLWANTTSSFEGRPYPIIGSGRFFQAQLTNCKREERIRILEAKLAEQTRKELKESPSDLQTTAADAADTAEHAQNGIDAEARKSGHSSVSAIDAIKHANLSSNGRH